MPKSIEYLTLSEAARILPGRTHVNTVRRWFDRGYRGVILRSWRCGNRRITTRQAIDEFIEATTGIAEKTTPQKSSAHLKAEAELDLLGVRGKEEKQ